MNMKKSLYLILICCFFSCKSDAELAMERGIKYFDWNKYEDAILEFNKAKYLQIIGIIFVVILILATIAGAFIFTFITSKSVITLIMGILFLSY